MPTIDDLRRQILDLGPEETQQLFTWFVDHIPPGKRPRRLWPVWLSGIESIPGVCGGEPCILRTRIAAWTLEQLRREGLSEADILTCYPTLRAEDLVHAWAYVDLHREEIDEQILAHGMA